MRILRVIICIGKWADDEQRDPEAQAKLINIGRSHVIIEPAILVPRDENDRTVPCWRFHQSIEKLHRPVLSCTYGIGGMLIKSVRGNQPAKVGECVVLYIVQKILGPGIGIGELVILLIGLQGIKDGSLG